MKWRRRWHQRRRRRGPRRVRYYSVDQVVVHVGNVRIVPMRFVEYSSTR